MENRNINATCNKLRYLTLAFAITPQFQRLPKIQRRFGLGIARNPVEAGFESKRALTARRGLGCSEPMPVNSEFPDLGFKRLSGYA